MARTPSEGDSSLKLANTEFVMRAIPSSLPASGGNADYATNAGSANNAGNAVQANFAHNAGNANSLGGQPPSYYFSLGNKGIVTGTYVGDGQASRFINLGFTPSAVDVQMQIPNFYGSELAETKCFCIQNAAAMQYPNKIILQIVTNGFTVAFNESDETYLNALNRVYLYKAWR